MLNKPRKTSMRQTVDEHSPTYQRAVNAIGKAVQSAGQPIRTDKPVFVRGARVKPKTVTE